MVHILPSLLTTEEVADTLRIPLPTAHYLKKKGKIPNTKIGGRYRYDKSAIEWMLDIVRVGTTEKLYSLLGDKIHELATSEQGGWIFILPPELPYDFAPSEEPDVYVVRSNDISPVPKDFRWMVIEIVQESEKQQYPGSMLTRDEHLGQALLQARAAKQAQKEEGLPS